MTYRPSDPEFCIKELVRFTRQLRGRPNLEKFSKVLESFLDALAVLEALKETGAWLQRA